MEGLYGDGRVGVEMLIRTIAEKGLRKGTWVNVAQRAPRSGRQNLDQRARAGILGGSGATSWRHSGPTNKHLPLNILVIEDRDVTESRCAISFRVSKIFRRVTRATREQLLPVARPRPISLVRK